MTLRELSLFTGYGGFSLGLRLAGINTRTVCYVENDPFCQEVIKARIQDGHLDDAPIWDDVRTFPGRHFRGLVDLVTAGFPCQPHSTAGKKRGGDDEKNLWPDTLRAISEMEPRLVLLENVPGILYNRYGGTVVGQLSELGYDCRWGVVSAAAVGAPHLRRRWWCLAHSTGSRRPEQQREHEAVGGDEQLVRNGEDGEMADSRQQQGEPGRNGIRPEPSAGGQDVAHSTGTRLEGGTGPELSPPQHSGSPSSGRRIGEDWWGTEPPLGRVAHGTPDRVGQLGALGNGIVPAVVAEFLRRIA